MNWSPPGPKSSSSRRRLKSLSLEPTVRTEGGAEAEEVVLESMK